MRKRLIRAADLFCGAGGTSTGLQMACDGMGYELDLFAVNHWDVAIATHSANHPNAQHQCASVDTVDPRVAVPGGRLDLLWASPECTFFSVARGGKPVTDQGRASAWLILRWAELLYIDTILIENVKEFRDWCPVGVNGRPMKSKKGETFRAFIQSLKSLGYRVEWKVLNAADYGAATTRERLFIQARRGRKPINWPNASHSKTGARGLFGNTKTWRAAKEVIEWQTPSKSIFGRKRPLAPATMARIIAGLEKFGGKELEPFLVILRNNQDAKSIHTPVPAITILPHRMFGGMQVDSVDDPVRTIVANNDAAALVEPFLIGAGGPTSGQRPQSIDKPLGTVLTENHKALIQPFIMPVNHGKDDMRTHSPENPLPTITSVDATGLVEPYIQKYYKSGDGVTPVSDPLPTVTTKDRFALVTPLVRQLEDGTQVALDIHFRMLKPSELARAMSFPDSYQFTGNREAIVKQIGNAVDGSMARALCEAVLS